MKILMIDNVDPFTPNLAQYFRRAGADLVTYRNDAGISVVEKTKPDLIVLSPGPSTPQNAGMSIDVVKQYGSQIPIFGVCLGMQSIMEAYGTKVHKLDEIVHGEASMIFHDGTGIFDGIRDGFDAGRYHSLGAYVDEVASPLEVTASTAMKHPIVMSVKHKEHPVVGVQFHPESVLTFKDNSGYKLIENVVQIYLNQMKVK